MPRMIGFYTIVYLFCEIQYEIRFVFKWEYVFYEIVIIPNGTIRFSVGLEDSYWHPELDS